MNLTHCDNKHFVITSSMTALTLLSTGPVNCVRQRLFLLLPITDASFPSPSPPTSLTSLGNFLMQDDIARDGGGEPWICLLPLSDFCRDRFSSWHFSCLFPFQLQDSEMYTMFSFPTSLMRMACSGEKKRDVWHLLDSLGCCFSMASHREERRGWKQPGEDASRGTARPGRTPEICIIEP